MSKIEYILEVPEDKDQVLQAIADEMELPDDTGVMDLIDILIDAEIDRYRHDAGE